MALFLSQKRGKRIVKRAQTRKRQEVTAFGCQQAGSLVVKQKKMFIIFNDV
jgi:hypothetical protein